MNLHAGHARCARALAVRQSNNGRGVRFSESGGGRAAGGEMFDVNSRRPVGDDDAMRRRLAPALYPLLLLAAACSDAAPPADEWGNPAAAGAVEDAAAGTDDGARAERERNFRPSRTPLVDFDLWGKTDLPVVATAGVIPSRDTIVLTIGAGGADAAVNGVAGTWEETRARLRPLCDLGRASPGAPSEITVLVVADRVTPWRHVVRALQAATDQNVAAPCVAFVVRISEDGACGTFATLLPEDRGACEHPGDVPVRQTTARILRAAAGDGNSAARPDMSAVSAACAAILRPGGVRAAARLDPHPETPLQVVLDAAEAAERGGARILGLVGVADSVKPEPATVAAAAAWTLEIEGGTPPQPWPVFTPRGRVKEGLGGFATRHYFTGEVKPPDPAEERSPPK